MANRGRQNKEGIQRFLSLTYLLIGGGVIVVIAVAVILIAALGSGSQSGSTSPSTAQDSSANTGSQEQSSTDDKPAQEESTQEVSLVTIEEFADFQCSHCMQFALGIGKQIKQDFVETGKIRFVFRHFPFIGPESFRAAEATECAADQNKFWEYHDTVFENWKGVNEGHFSDKNLKLFAGSLQLDRGAFDACFDSRKYLGKVESDIRRGEQLGVQGTPSLFLNGRMLTPSSNEELIQLIESAIAAAQ